MKIKSVAAVGALGVGLGVASFIGGTGTASAACNLATTPPLERAACLAENYTNSFLTTTDPFYNYNVLVYGTDEGGVRSGLGLVDQPATFVDSIVGEGGFLSGPIGPDGPPPAAGPNTPPPN